MNDWSIPTFQRKKNCLLLVLGTRFLTRLCQPTSDILNANDWNISAKLFHIDERNNVTRQVLFSLNSMHSMMICFREKKIQFSLKWKKIQKRFVIWLGRIFLQWTSASDDGYANNGFRKSKIWKTAQIFSEPKVNAAKTTNIRVHILWHDYSKLIYGCEC